MEFGHSFKAFIACLAISCAFLGQAVADPSYLAETPLKLLDVKSVASRYAAANSEYRTNMENGQVRYHLFYIYGIEL